MKEFKPKIAVYQTNESGFTIFSFMLRKAITERGLAIDVVGITAEEIRNGALKNKSYTGLVMPGRNKGQDYRDELGVKGFEAIYCAAYDGTAVHATCAASYVLATQGNWVNDFDPSENKIIHNPNGLYHGKAIGAFNDVWRSGFRSDGNYAPNTLAGVVTEIDFLYDDLEQEGHGLYVGGGNYVADPDSDQNPIVLARHRGTIRVQNALSYETDFYVFQDPAAIIEFNVGKGKVMFFNIHTEIDMVMFDHIFRITEQAQKYPKAFERNKLDLGLSARHNQYMFNRFTDNSMINHENYHDFSRSDLGILIFDK